MKYGLEIYSINQNQQVQDLGKISKWLIKSMRSFSAVADILDPSTEKGYHGFRKARIKPELLEICQNACGTKIQYLQAEIATVSIDLSHTIHFHKEAYALCTILGRMENVDEARFAESYLRDSWSPLKTGDIVYIPQGVHHTFNITRPDGILHFLSVQTPDVDRPGYDDFHYVK